MMVGPRGRILQLLLGRFIHFHSHFVRQIIWPRWLHFKWGRKGWSPARNSRSWTSLVVQWIGIYLPMQRTGVQSLVQEDSTCHGATTACMPQLPSLCSRAHELQLLKLMCLETVFCKKGSYHNEKPAHPHSPQLEKAHTKRQTPSTAVNKIKERQQHDQPFWGMYASPSHREEWGTC